MSGDISSLMKEQAIPSWKEALLVVTAPVSVVTRVLGHL